MTIYTVWSGEYSDRCMSAVFQSKEKAEKYIEIHDKIDNVWSDGYYIVEYEFDDDKIDLNSTPKKYYYAIVTMNDWVGENGEIIDKAGDVETDDSWRAFMHDYLIESVEDLKPSVYNQKVIDLGENPETVEEDYGAPVEWRLDDRDSFVDIDYSHTFDTETQESITTGIYSIQGYSAISYAHARKIALDEYYKQKALQEGLV